MAELDAIAGRTNPGRNVGDAFSLFRLDNASGANGVVVAPNMPLFTFPANVCQLDADTDILLDASGGDETADLTVGAAKAWALYGVSIEARFSTNTALEPLEFAGHTALTGDGLKIELYDTDTTTLLRTLYKLNSNADLRRYVGFPGGAGNVGSENLQTGTATKSWAVYLPCYPGPVLMTAGRILRATLVTTNNLQAAGYELSSLTLRAIGIESIVQKTD